MLGRENPQAKSRPAAESAKPQHVVLLIICGYYIQNSNFLFLRSLEVIAWSTLIFGILLYFADKVFLRVKKLMI